MKLYFLLLALTLPLQADPQGKLVFSDNFDRDEAVPDKEDVGNGWTTNSAWRAPGKKQVDLKDGVLYGGTDPTAGHGLVLFHPAGLRDGAVELKFKVGKNESFNAEFADPACKTVHAGHLAMVKVSPGQLTISDLKTGRMNLRNRERRLALKPGQKDAELEAILKSKSRSFPLKLKPDQWHTLHFSVNDSTMTASVDGDEIGSFTSEGFDHPIKHEIRVNIGKSASMDDVKIWKVR